MHNIFSEKKTEKNVSAFIFESYFFQRNCINKFMSNTMETITALIRILE